MARILTAVLFCWLVATSCGGMAAASAGEVPVTVSVTLTTVVGDPLAASPATRTETFSLTCNPTGGTLPLAERICEDIRVHPVAMLDPRPFRFVCSATLGGPRLWVSVVTHSGGRARTLAGGSAFCGPDEVGGAVYFAATQQDSKSLDRLEVRLRCDEEPFLFTKPSPDANIVACIRGLWTPRAEAWIRRAAAVPEVAALRPGQLFPQDIGARPCAIRSGGRTLRGTCGVYLRHRGDTANVSFVETWPVEPKGKASHVWRVVVRTGAASLVSESGPIPPQLRR